MMTVKMHIVIKRAVDMLLCIVLLCLMAYQITGEKLHEYLGVFMFVLVLVHQLLNRKWYFSMFKGKYGAYRILMTSVNILLLLSFILTALSGMAISGYALPFMYGVIRPSFSRVLHLGMSYWSFLLMSVHLGIHIPQILSGVKLKSPVDIVLYNMAVFASAVGLYYFISNGIAKYLFFREHFVFFDYDKSAGFVFLESILMLLLWVFIGSCGSILCQKNTKTGNRRGLFSIFSIVLISAVGVSLSFVVSKRSSLQFNSLPNRLAGDDNFVNRSFDNMSNSIISNTTGKTDESMIDDGFVLLEGNIFEMGSPESENWRSDDEKLHTVALSSFYISPYEVTQEEYLRLTGNNPSYFNGEKLPVENISWIDAVQFANKKSIDAGLEPAYSVSSENVVWNMGANGYRLPTEAEWEFACRAGSKTPFHTQRSIDAAQANFYGHYPYEIEENYFNDSVLEARPGVYRQKTINVGSFKPNGWGLYDMHGNVNEWCWDFYGDYQTHFTVNPTGPESGSRHVYRGGGWNDFAKNMRSAYRAAGQDDMRSHNIGIRLVRNSGNDRKGEVTVLINQAVYSATDEKILIAYFSWSGNTRRIAKEIQKQLKADIFEIVPVRAYSSEYNKVLMQAQEDQHKNKRPELRDHIDNIDEYGIIILGYPNWWASIPAPVATFLEEYDLSNKKIYPFCSHGGGRFGQSLTAIAKLAPGSNIRQGLSVHYSGGSALQNDILDWLKSGNLI